MGKFSALNQLYLFLNCVLFAFQTWIIMSHAIHTYMSYGRMEITLSTYSDIQIGWWKKSMKAKSTFSIFIKMNFQSLLLLYQHTVIWLIQFVISMYWKRIDSFVQVSWLKNSEKPWPWEYRKIDVPENWNSNNLM